MKKAGAKILGLMLSLVVLAAGAVVGLKYFEFAIAPVDSQGGELIVDVPPHSTFAAVRARLEQAGVKIDKVSYKAWLWWSRADRKLRVGEFRTDRSWSVKRILNELVKGTPILRKIVLKEGHNIWDLEKEMQSTGLQPDVSKFRALMKDPALLKRAQVPAAPKGVTRTLEGFLFPETYSFQKYDSARVVVEEMLRQFETRALPILKSHPWGATPEGRYRLLTLASVVEKESGVASEQPLIASVFWNCLNKRMKLQSDPTIIYGLMPNFDGNIHKNQILAPTPYNTYTIPELPAGPIANPGESALRAVVQPAQSDYLFFVAKGDGTHIFAKDYGAHTNYVRQYQLGGRRSAMVGPNETARASGAAKKKAGRPKKEKLRETRRSHKASPRS